MVAIKKKKEQVCTKVCYSSQMMADADIKRIQKHSKKMAALPMSSYLCPHCHVWHLTTKGREMQQILGLEEKIRDLAAENLKLKQFCDKEVMVSVRTDVRVRQLSHENKRLKEEVIKHKKAISDLVSKLHAPKPPSWKEKIKLAISELYKPHKHTTAL